ncbi:hypothetical protein C8F04DRAFT_255421 [Mycena alexandri]|uniref:RRM domain-containing protein n=1 Tax=Mycena alexandri TaxID=1745969 RepID=A0AAD6T6N8_9AGAR|nr:hypothetical protein C8F04DRAFT_255421 [Mycena alexandri]
MPRSKASSSSKTRKGGVCAFVQCENAAAASSLINTLHSNAPKHFLGRVLRYEPARAFRTLLISYRAPVQFIPSGDRGKGGGETIQLDPPLAMRIWRPRNTKYLSLLYNTEAVDAENHASSVRDSANDPGLFLQPVVFDENSIKMLCAHFGPLESFGLFNASEAANDPERDLSTKSLPYPHDGPRLPQMSGSCWEVKWSHRDDSVSALMTLRRVPHLTVTWAHQPAPFGFENQRGRFPFNQSDNGTSYPFHVQNFAPPSQPRHQSFGPSPNTTQSNLSQNSSTGGLGLHGNSSAEVSFSVSSTNTDDWKRITAPSPGQCYDSSASFRSAGFFDPPAKKWTEVDFPPLGDSKSDRRAEQGVWADKKAYKGEGELPDRPSSSLSVVIADPTGAVHDPNGVSYQNEEQEVDMPETPGLEMSPITPKTSGSQFPTTPTSTDGDLQRSAFQEYESKEKNGYFDEVKELDPTTLFVGGLEMYGSGAWDEERVSAFFGRFGGLESVKVVRPQNARSAFAFVKFNNTESPARAVFEEHNRVHDGRAMRVQLRDCNPPRGGGNWRYSGRARGRFPHSHYGSQRRYPEAPNQSTPDFQENNSGVTDEVVAMKSLSLADETAGAEPVGSVVEPDDFAVTCYAVEEEPPKVAPPHLRGDQTQSCPASRRQSPEPSTAPEVPPQPEYREWYDEPASATMTPPPPSLNSSAAAPSAPYPMPNGGYYPPPWAQPYQQMPYGVPYYPGFAGYPMQGPQPSQPYSSPGGSDASGPASVPQRPWPSMGMYGQAYISYPAYPPRPSVGVDQSNPRGQAPLQPTGFIQNEQGTLIPVYQPEALDQYMASNQATPATTPATQPQNGTAAWQQYPPPPFPHPIHPMTGMPPRAFPVQPQASVNGNWVGQFPPPHPPSHATQAPNGLNHPNNFRGGYQEMGGEGMGPNGRRNPGRRDQHPNGPNNRNNSGRPMPNRHPRGGMHHMPYAPHEGGRQMQQPSRPAQFNSAPADWSQWTGTR